MVASYAERLEPRLPRLFLPCCFFVVQSMGDGVGTTNELMDKVRRKEFKKRRVSVSPVICVRVCAGCVGAQ